MLTTFSIDFYDYKFGFQGQESEDEIWGEGNASFYKYRISDNRLGRFFAIDPLAAEYPHNSPYAFSENVIIDHFELEGLEKSKRSAVKCPSDKTKKYRMRLKIIRKVEVKTIYPQKTRTFTRDGLNQPLNMSVKMSGGVKVEFTTYAISDRLTVTDENDNPIITTGNVSTGSDPLTRFGTVGTSQIIRFNVVPDPTNTPFNTKWDLEVTELSQRIVTQTNYKLFGFITIFKEETESTRDTRFADPLAARRDKKIAGQPRDKPNSLRGGWISFKHFRKIKKNH
jgi:hypothetical protein